MDCEDKLRMAMQLIQMAKDCLSPMNNEDKALWNVTCDLESARGDIEGTLKYYIKDEIGTGRLD